MTTSHPHSSEEERDNIVNVVLKWINDLPLDRVALVQVTSDEWKRLYAALESREKDLLAQSHQSAEAKMLAEIQALVITPNISEEFGTLHHTGVVIKLLEYVERKLKGQNRTALNLPKEEDV